MAEILKNTKQDRFIWEECYPEGVTWDIDVPQKPLYDLFDQAVANYGDKPCTSFMGAKLSYAEMGSQINKAAKGLQLMGIKKGDRVGIFLPNCPTFIIMYYAVLKCGGIVVNYNPLYADHEVRHQIQDSGTRFMITLNLKQLLEKLEARLEDTNLEKIIVANMQDLLPSVKSFLFGLFRRKEIASYEASTTHVPFTDLVDNNGKYDHVDIDSENDIAVLQYTGGTTGVPKGAMLTHRNLYVNAYQPYYWFNNSVEYGAEKVLAVLPFFHVYAMTTVMNFGVLIGAEMALLPRFDLKQTLQAIHKEKPGFFNAVPTIYNAINNHKDLHKYDLSSLKTCISGGAPLPVEVLKTFEKNAPNATLVEGYGLSETSPIACVNPYGDVRVDGSIGLPVSLTEVHIISTEDGETLMPIGEKGEICIKGPQVMKGYWKNEEATARDLRRGFFHTGDVGYMDERGFIYIVDRMKDVIIAGGYNIYPRNVEEALYQHPNVEECIVLGVPDEYRGETVKAYIKTHDGEDIPLDNLKTFLKDKLSPIEMPKLYEFRAELPKTMIGKLSKKELREEMEK